MHIYTRTSYLRSLVLNCLIHQINDRLIRLFDMVLHRNLTGPCQRITTVERFMANFIPFIPGCRISTTPEKKPRSPEARNIPNYQVI